MYLVKNDLVVLDQINVNLEKLLGSIMDLKYKVDESKIKVPLSTMIVDVNLLPIVTQTPLTMLEYVRYLVSRQIYQFPNSHSSHYFGPVGDVFHTFCDLEHADFLKKVATNGYTCEQEYVFIPSYFISLYLLALYSTDDNLGKIIPNLLDLIIKELEFVKKYLGKGKIDPRLFPGFKMLVANLSTFSSKTGKKGAKVIEEIINIIYEPIIRRMYNNEWGYLYETIDGIGRFREIPIYYDYDDDSIEQFLIAHFGNVETSLVESDLRNTFNFATPERAVTSVHYINPTIIDPLQYPNIKYIKKADKDEKDLAKDKMLLEKTKKLIIELSNDPFTSRFKAEPLKGNLHGWKSIRTTQKDRIVFQNKNNLVVLLMLKGHY
ncbi:MAG: Toxin RelK [Tenericutes bacterium ADurb.Bin239]|nr:MAG: Toxin RelK [Tenericutes bacterium ADurb.Bin239]